MFRREIIRSSIWSFGGFGAGQALRLASNLILTRLLFPEAFGLMALITIFMIGLEMFTDLGIGASVIQNKRGEEAEFLNTAWTIKVLRGIVIYICVCLLAYPVAWFYGEPQFLKLVPVMGLSALFAGFASIAPALAMRKLWVGRSTVLIFGCQLLSTVVMVFWAWFEPSVWALVAGNLVNAFALAILSHCIFPNWRVRFQWNQIAAGEIIRFGKWMFLTSALTFLAGQIDRLTLAKLLPLDLVGIYSIGYMWGNLPLQLIQTWAGRVMFPLASETLRKPNANRSQLTTYRRRVIWLMAIGIGFFGGLSTLIFRLLYTPEYWGAADFLSLILIGTMIKTLDELYRPFNLALGQPVYSSAGAALSILIFGTAVYPLYQQFSGHGIAIAYSISQIGALAATTYGVRQAELSDIRMDAAALTVTLAIWATLYLMVDRLV